MKTNWDYTNLADSYLKRPNYSEQAINDMIKFMKLPLGAKVCDIGAGVAHLTLILLRLGFNVVAIEPNDAMRKNGIERTKTFKNIIWDEGTGEDTKQSDHIFDMVTFGSSFNVTDRLMALNESVRILKPKGWFACMWNHRDVNDPIQQKIESIIKSNIIDYSYGTRREDQTDIINSTSLFGTVKKIEGKVNHLQTLPECIEAWKSHATLERQAKDKFHLIILQIEDYLNSLNAKTITVPYTTRIWIAQAK